MTGKIPYSGLSSKADISRAVLKDLKRPLHSDYKVEIVGEGKEELIKLMNYCWHRDPAPRPEADYVVITLEHLLKKISPEESAIQSNLGLDSID